MRPPKHRGRKLSKSEQMARVRSKDTTPEVLLRRALWSSGLRYRLRLKLPGTPDIAITKSKIAIFVDGCFWHGCPEHYTKPVRNADFWKKKLERNVSRDRSVDLKLARLGWTVIRVWEHEVSSELDRIVARIAGLVRERQA